MSYVVTIFGTLVSAPLKLLPPLCCPPACFPLFRCVPLLIPVPYLPHPVLLSPVPLSMTSWFELEGAYAAYHRWLSVIIIVDLSSLDPSENSYLVVSIVLVHLRRSQLFPGSNM